MARRETMGTAKAKRGQSARQSTRPTEKQCKVLAKRGLPTPKTRKKATELIGELEANGWRVTESLKQRAAKMGRKKKRNRKGGKSVWQKSRERRWVEAGHRTLDAELDAALAGDG